MDRMLIAIHPRLTYVATSRVFKTKTNYGQHTAKLRKTSKWRSLRSCVVPNTVDGSTRDSLLIKLRGLQGGQ